MLTFACCLLVVKCHWSLVYRFSYGFFEEISFGGVGSVHLLVFLYLRSFRFCGDGDRNKNRYRTRIGSEFGPKYLRAFMWRVFVFLYGGYGSYCTTYGSSGFGKFVWRLERIMLRRESNVLVYRTGNDRCFCWSKFHSEYFSDYGDEEWGRIRDGDEYSCGNKLRGGLHGEF